MEKPSYTIQKLASGDSIPFDLLLLADETIEAIEKYIYQSDIYFVNAKEQLNPIGVFVLYKINKTEIEIKNMAISKELQSKGIGSYIIEEIKAIARRGNYKQIIVGTADCGIRQIKFYEKNGFAKYAVRKNFFINNYARPIIENGIMLKDMVLLKTQLL